MSLLPLRLSTLPGAVRRTLALKDTQIKMLRARVMVLTEDLEIAETQYANAERSADDWHTRFVQTLETATKVLDMKEIAEAKLKEIAKLVDSDYNNGMILGGYELTASIRRILK